MGEEKGKVTEAFNTWLNEQPNMVAHMFNIIQDCTRICADIKDKREFLLDKIRVLEREELLRKKEIEEAKQVLKLTYNIDYAAVISANSL